MASVSNTQPAVTGASGRTRGRHVPAKTSQPIRTSRLIRFETIVYAILICGLVLCFSPGLQVQFTLPKLLILRAVTPVLVVLWILRLRGAETRRLPASILAAGMALGLWWTLTTLTAVHRPTALDGAHGRFNGLWTHSLLLTLFVLSATAPLSHKELTIRLRVLLGALMLAALYTVAQRLGWDPFTWPFSRPASTVGSPVILATTLGLGVPFALAFALEDGHPLAKCLWALIAASLVFAAVLTLSRGPLLGLVLSLVMMTAGALRFRGISRTAATMAVAGVLVVLTVSGAFVVRARSGRFLPTLGSVTREGEIQVRLHTLGAAARMLRDYPIVGVGFENFGLLYPRYRPPAAERGMPDVLPTMVHSTYLQLAVTTGLPGLGLYVVFLLAVLIPFLRAYRENTNRSTSLRLAAFLAAIAGYLAADLTGWPEVALSALFWMLLGMGVSAAMSAATVFRPEVPVFASAPASAWTVVTVVLAFQAVTLARADRLIAGARASAALGDWTTSQTMIERALPLAGPRAPYEDAAGYLFAERFGITGDRDMYDRAARLFADAHRLDPFNEYYLIHRIDLETAALQKWPGSRASDGANAACAAALAFERHNGAVYASVARMRLAAGAPPEALEMIRRAEALRPQLAQYRTLEGDIHRAADDRSSAAAAYRRALGNIAAGTPDWFAVKRRLIVTLLEMGDQQTAIDEARQTLARDPNDSVTRKLLEIALEASKGEAR